MPIFEIKLPKITGGRKETRDAVVSEFLKEQPGSGTGDLSTIYRYEAELIPGCARIILKRPAWLNKGMDFTVHVDGWQFKTKGANRDAPRHSDIVADLARKKSIHPRKYAVIARLINDIFNCEEIDHDYLSGIKVKEGLTVAQSLLAVKWLFIEQDVTYWNSSGRHMLYANLKSSGLC